MRAKEGIVVRIRGTFIDVGDSAVSEIRRKRSSSAPPCPGLECETESMMFDDSTSVGSEECHYLTTWIDQAKILADSRMGSDCRPCDDELAFEPVQESEPTQRLQSTQDDDICSCGTAYTQDAKFCFCCGQPRDVVCFCGTSIMPASSFCYRCGQSKRDLLLRRRHGINPTSDFSPTSEASWETMSSVGSCARETASTWDSEGDMNAGRSLAEEKRKAADETVPSTVTTLMICDIPCRQTIQQLMDAIHAQGFAGTYDLIYMPPQKGRHTPKHSQNMGYAFVNFKQPEYATAFARVFQNFRFPSCYSTKLSYTKPARCQGYEANAEMHAKHRISGCLVTFRDEPFF